MPNTKQKTENIPPQTLEAYQKALEANFPTEDVYQRDAGFGGKKLNYISIPKIYGRMNEVFPLGYSWVINSTQVIEDSFILTGTLTINLPDGSQISRCGIGSDILRDRKGKVDMDKTSKTAMAEAFKKACHTLGVGLYLWDPEENLKIERERSEARTATFTQDHLDKMKKVRSKLNIKNDNELNLLIAREYPDTNINNKKDLRPDNIDRFLKWALEEKIGEPA
jgi:hypothetical protein